MASASHGHPAVFIEVGQTSLRLKIGVLLERRTILALNDHIGGRKGRVDVALADPVPDADIARSKIRVQQRRVGLHCSDRIGQNRQILILDLDQSNGRCRVLLACGNNGRHLVTDEANNIGAGFGRSGTAQHRLVWYLQAVLIYGNVRRRENGHHAMGASRGARVDIQDACMWALGKHCLHVEHAGH